MRSFPLVMVMTAAVSTGCRGLMSHPLFQNHTCPTPYVIAAQPVPGTTAEQWYGQQPSPQVVMQTPHGPNAMATVPVQTIPGMPGAAALPQTNSFQVAEAKYEESPTVIETLLSLRDKIDNLQQDSHDVKKKLQESQEQTMARVIANEEATTNMTEELTSMQQKIELWRTDVNRLRSRVREQQTRHEETLRDVENELNDMLDTFETSRPAVTTESSE